MCQPEGFIMTGKENLVCHLNQSIHGLKQSSMNWNISFREFLDKLGFSKSNNELHLYLFS